MDPKRVELGNYNDLPHLLAPVVVDPKKAASALDWAVREMERRYDLLAEHGVRDLAGYNEALARGELTRPGSRTGARHRRRGRRHDLDDADRAASPWPTTVPERCPSSSSSSTSSTTS